MSAGAQAMPLAFAKSGERLSIEWVSGPVELRRHLQELGFVPGAQVYVASSTPTSMIVDIKGARLGLDVKVLSHVFACLDDGGSAQE
ncbi:MAG: FeoA family protein [Coriobacteriaceae bacterium]|nr:FeoA family protein [Coriobacteriaceae bacterium]